MKKNTFTLIHNQTGQAITALVLPRSRGGKFMKIWQGNGWDDRIKLLHGQSLQVLLHLLFTAGWGNKVGSPVDTANSMSLHRVDVYRAYRELVNADFIRKADNAYLLNPFFCWKGNDDQYQQACIEFKQFQLTA